MGVVPDVTTIHLLGSVRPMECLVLRSVADPLETPQAETLSHGGLNRILVEG